MKEIVFALCLAFSLHGSVVAQQNYTIRYGYYNYFDSLFESKKNSYLIRSDILFLNGDSLSFYWSAKLSGKKQNGTVGEKRIHHAVYTFPLLHRHLHENAWTKPYNLVETETRSFNWTIVNETKIIEGFTCKLGISGDVRAWFTEDIPVSSGPSIYNGLPGLILRLDDYKYDKIYEVISVKVNSPKIILPDLPIEKCKNCETRREEIKNYFGL